MIKPTSRLLSVDNSGAIQIGCISIAKLDKRRGAATSSIVTASIKKNIFKKNIRKKSKILNKSQVVRAVLLLTRKELKRQGNFTIKSNRNAAIILNQYGLPYATRLFGPIFREVRKKTLFRKVVSLARSLV